MPALCLSVDAHWTAFSFDNRIEADFRPERFVFSHSTLKDVAMST